MSNNRNTYDATQGDSKSKTPWIIGGVALFVAVVAGIVFLSGSGDDGGDGGSAASNSEQETASVVISGEDLPRLTSEGGLPAADEDTGWGLEPPKLSGESFDKSAVVIDPADGTPKVVVFLAHWCPHCQAEVPKIQQWIDDGNLPEGVEIYSVSTAVDEGRPNYPASSWLASEGWTQPVMLDDQAQSAFNAYGASGFPFFVMIDGEGKVFQRGSGELPIEEFDARVNDLASTSAAAESATSAPAA